jgi:hypothetical protein
VSLRIVAHHVGFHDHTGLWPVLQHGEYRLLAGRVMVGVGMEIVVSVFGLVVDSVAQ